MRYEFETPNGMVVEKDFPMGQCPKEITMEDGTVAQRIWSLPAFIGACQTQDTYQVCDATGCTDNQLPAIRKQYAKHGLKAQFKRSSDGFLQEVFSSRKDRKRKCELRGFHDLNAGYSDPARKKDQ